MTLVELAQVAAAVASQGADAEEAQRHERGEEESHGDNTAAATAGSQRHVHEWLQRHECLQPFLTSQAVCSALGDSGLDSTGEWLSELDGLRDDGALPEFVASVIRHEKARKAKRPPPLLPQPEPEPSPRPVMRPPVPVQEGAGRRDAATPMQQHSDAPVVGILDFKIARAPLPDEDGCVPTQSTVPPPVSELRPKLKPTPEPEPEPAAGELKAGWVVHFEGMLWKSSSKDRHHSRKGKWTQRYCVLLHSSNGGAGCLAAGADDDGPNLLCVPISYQSTASIHKFRCSGGHYDGGALLVGAAATSRTKRTGVPRHHQRRECQERFSTPGASTSLSSCNAGVTWIVGSTDGMI
jgi:hypothetical protein